ncbi:MAG: hypothetical protein A3B25_03490 [Candidatus Ryanbacteria bacterium RIFCSPLOWO2_01_FULL_48_26]|uniref:Uncharacterized protein n=1 Tax=Candidatus Ryanbacteria bacterium RIFCSPLOWO2_01_FULL_48_26 TaxID=1802126 RepID=A0A1G2GR57_9BACT|nr:MAG: hypothetical protein A3B25_03490 [Candidatus Ryanbacteria bacterium RIFCSPLOWO2_01_FULL_48_26]
MTEGEKRECERQEKLHELQDLVHRFEGDLQDMDGFQDVSRLDKYMRLLCVFLGEIDNVRSPVYVLFLPFVRDSLMFRLNGFSKTPDELRFMQVKMMEFFVAIILNESSWKLRDQEMNQPEVFYGVGKARASKVAEK